MKPVILAIDPGLSGAVVRLSGDGIVARRDFKALPDIARAIDELATGCDAAIIENVHAMPGQGVVSMFNFGKATGVAHGALTLSLPDGARLDVVAPLRWQNYYRRELGMEKDWVFDSREIALRMFPLHALLFKRKKDHNTADAVLMASYELAHLN